MIRSKKTVAERLLSESQKAKGILYKTRESLLGVNSDMADETAVLQGAISDLESQKDSLNSEITSNQKVIKNIDKILDI